MQFCNGIFGKIILLCNFAMQFCNAILQCNFAMQFCNAILQCNFAMQFSNAILLCNSALQFCTAILQCNFATQFHKESIFHFLIATTMIASICTALSLVETPLNAECRYAECHCAESCCTNNKDQGLFRENP